MKPRIVADARTFWADGAPSQLAKDVLRAQYPGVNASDIASWVDWAYDAADLANRLTEYNPRRFGNPTRIAGCIDPLAKVRVYISITFMDNRIGMERTYSHVAEMSGKGTIGQQIYQAIEAVRQQALAQNYEIGNLGYESTAGDPRYQLRYAECI